MCVVGAREVAATDVISDTYVTVVASSCERQSSTSYSFVSIAVSTFASVATNALDN